MNQIYKQSVVMLFSVAFVVIMSIIVLSSTSAATTAAEIGRDNMESVRDSNLDRAESVLSGNYYQKPNIHHTFSDERIPHHTTPYFNDEPIVYDNHHEIERLEDEIETMRYEAENEQNTDNGGYKIAFWFIVVFIVFIALVNHSNKNATPDYADRDTEDNDPYEYIEIYRPDTTNDTSETSQYMEDEDDYDYDNFMNKWQQISSDRTGRK